MVSVADGVFQPKGCDVERGNSEQAELERSILDGRKTLSFSDSYLCGFDERTAIDGRHALRLAQRVCRDLRGGDGTRPLHHQVPPETGSGLVEAGILEQVLEIQIEYRVG